MARGEIDATSLLKDRIARGTLDLETAWACTFHYKAIKLAGLSRTERLRTIKHDCVGAPLLNWVWKDDERFTHALVEHPLFFRPLCYFLVAEGNQDYLIELLKVESPARKKLPPHWRGFMLRGLVKAQLETTLGTGADNALDTFSVIRREIQQAHKEYSPKYYDRGDEYASTSLWPSFSEFWTALSSGAWPRTTQSKYVSFVEAFSKIGTRKAADSRWSHARISLFIPGAPDYRPALSTLKDLFANQNNQEIRAKMPHDGPAARAQIYFACRRLEELLHADGQEDDLRWVKHLRNRLFTKKDLVHFRDSWRRMLKAFGIENPRGDLETVVTYDPVSYWMKHRDEELRLYLSTG